MAEETGRPTFDISSFFAFAFPWVEQPQLPPGQPPEASTNETGGFEEDHELRSPEVEHPAADDDNNDERVDLTRYGAPDVLTRIWPIWSSQDAAQVVVDIVQTSVNNVRTQVAAEAELCRRQVEGESLKTIEKGKGVDLSPSEPDAVSHGGDNDSFHTTSEGRITPESVHHKAVCYEQATAENNDVDLASARRPQLGSKAISASTLYPRRRDLLKTFFRTISDTDTRPVHRLRHINQTDTRHCVVRRSSSITHGMDLKQKLRHAKERLHHTETIQTACVHLCLDSVPLIYSQPLR